MKTEQRTITTIIAGEGKILRRKSDGWLAGKELTLGYNYYEAGIGLSEPKLETPQDYEEIDVPGDYNPGEVIDHSLRLSRAMELVEQERESINLYNLSNQESLDLKELFPEWKAGVAIDYGYKCRYGENLWEAIQGHTTQVGWEPGENTYMLWKVVTPEEHTGTEEDAIPYKQGMILELGEYYTQYGELYVCIQGTNTGFPNDLKDLPSLVKKVTPGAGEGEGTLENPIQYNPPMEIFKDKYYIQDGIVYKCTRDSGIELSHNLADLIGHYVEKVE